MNRSLALLVSALNARAKKATYGPRLTVKLDTRAYSEGRRQIHDGPIDFETQTRLCFDKRLYRSLASQPDHNR